jgi:protein TonB
MSRIEAKDEFDLLLDDVLRSVANPELPERVRVQVRTRVWVREMAAPKRAAVVFAPAVFQERMNPKRDARSTAAAVLVHAAAIALVFWLSAMRMGLIAPKRATEVTAISTPPPMPMAKSVMGGGGGQRGPTPVTKGQMPKFAETQITPPAKLEEPKIKMPDATIEVQKDLKMANDNLPNLGDPRSTLMGMSMGNGSGSGLGAGNGSGLGPGSGGNFGGGIRHVGGGVSAPVPIYEVEPEFSEEARKAKFMGVVTVNLIVDTKGMPQNVHVLRGVGMGLDQKAVEAVEQYRFRPAMEAGKPVPVQLNVEVNFQIF